nr:MAG TPA: Baseplate J like protein [Caudoviricetes sp.]
MIIKKNWKEILKDMLSNVNEEYDKSEGGLFYDNLAPVSIEFEELRRVLDYIFLNSFAETAQGEYLDNITKEVGVYRKQATKSKGTVIIKGTPNTVIEVGTKVASDTYIYVTTEEKIIGASGSVEVPIESENTGKIYNLPKNTINKFPITIPNLNEVNNLKETTDGYDGETDDELRERYYFKVREPVTSGNVYHYKKWAMEVEGVGGVKVFPLWNGNGTVKVVVVNSDIGEADTTLLKRVRDYLEEVRPIGATVTVNSAVGKSITLNGKIKISKNVKFDDVKTEIESKIKEYFRKVGFKQDYVSYAQIGNIILNVQGVVDYDNLLLNNKSINVQLTAEEIPKLSTVTFTKEVV